MVKYDTPFLVSTTINNKKTLEDLDDNNENAEIFLRNIINKKEIDVILNFRKFLKIDYLKYCHLYNICCI